MSTQTRSLVAPLNVQEAEDLRLIPPEQAGLGVRTRSRAPMSEEDRLFIDGILDKISLGTHDRKLIFLIATRMLFEVRAKAKGDRSAEALELETRLRDREAEISQLQSELAYFRARAKFNPAEIDYIVSHHSHGITEESLAGLLGGTAEDIADVVRGAKFAKRSKEHGQVRFAHDRSLPDTRDLAKRTRLLEE